MIFGAGPGVVPREFTRDQCAVEAQVLDAEQGRSRRPTGPGLVPDTGPLEIDHRGGEIGKCHRRQRTAEHAAEVHDQQLVKWSHAIVQSRRAPAATGPATR